MSTFELSYHPEIQKKLRDEINEVLSRHNGEMTYEAIEEMTYLQQVLYGKNLVILKFQISKNSHVLLTHTEIMRLYSPLPILVRSAMEDYLIPGTEITIEKGTKIMIPTCAIHRDSRYYYDPLKFDPSRFSPEEVKKRPSNCWLPLGDGPRNCIGLRYGIMTTKLAIAILFKNFEFEHRKETFYPPLYDNANMLTSTLYPIKVNIKSIVE